MNTANRLRKQHKLSKTNTARTTVLTTSLVHKFTATHHTAATRKAGRKKTD